MSCINLLLHQTNTDYTKPKEENLMVQEGSGSSSVEFPSKKETRAELMELKPDICEEGLLFTREKEDSDVESNEDEKDSNFDIKEELSKQENSDSEDDDSEEDFFQEELIPDNQFETITVKSYSSITVKEEPIENVKLIFKESPLEHEKERYHQLIFEEIFQNSIQISVKELQNKYLDQLHLAASTQIFTCSLCKYQTMSMTNLKCHLLVIHNGKTEVEMFKCNICSYEANFKSHIRKHMVKHKITVRKPKRVKKQKKKDRKIEKYPCSQCSYQGFSEDKLKKHMSVHKDKSNCDLCSFNSTDNDTLQKHKDTHKDGKKFLCYLCSYTITNKATLGRHLLNVHKIANEASKRSKMCEICSFSCSSRHQLKIHYLSHKPVTDLKEEDIHKCTECNYQTKYKSNMKKHLLMHKDPELICEICGFATRHKRSYEYHLITHKKLDEIEWFRCTVCPYQARNKKLLRQHIRKGDHSGKRLKHVRNRDRIREAEEKGEPIEAVIQKYKIKRIGGVEIKRERIRKPRDPDKKRVRKIKKAKTDNDMTDDTLENFDLGELAAAVVKDELSSYQKTV